MKIGIVCYPTFGGSGVVATELGKALAGQGHEVHFITYAQPIRLGSFRPNIFYHEVNVSDYPLFDYPPYELVLASKLVDVVKNEGLNLLHVHYAIPHASAAYTAKQILKTEGIHIPVVTTLHGTDITLLGKDSSFQPVIAFAINQSDAVTAVSHSLKNDTYKLFGIDRDIQVVPNFVCMDKMTIEIPEGMKLNYAPNGEKVLCHISNFRPVKRVLDVINVFKGVVEKIPSKLLMVGDGPERNEAQVLARELGIDEHVIFVGKLKNPLEVLGVSDLFILPSESESFGLAALEAMAMKNPVITTNTGGLPEVNRHGVSGMMSNVGDIEDMIDNALFVLEDEKKLEQFKEKAYKRASSFDLKNVLPMYIDVYNHAIKATLEHQS